MQHAPQKARHGTWSTSIVSCPRSDVRRILPKTVPAGRYLPIIEDGHVVDSCGFKLVKPENG